MPVTLIGACKDFFGTQPGQTLAEFRDEIKALTDKDREDIKQWLAAEGYTFKD